MIYSFINNFENIITKNKYLFIRKLISITVLLSIMSQNYLMATDHLLYDDLVYLENIASNTGNYESYDADDESHKQAQNVTYSGYANNLACISIDPQKLYKKAKESFNSFDDKQNSHEAFKLFVEVAQHHYIKAYNFLAFMHFNGYGTPIDHEHARALYSFAAKKGNLKAQYSYALMCYQGLGGEINSSKAWDNFMLVAKGKHTKQNFQANALFCMANLVHEKKIIILNEHNKINVSNDSHLNNAFSLYELAANRGHIQAMTYTGIMLTHGVGVNKDLLAAREFLLTPALKRDIHALYELSCLDYELGLDTSAQIYMMQAAQAGHLSAVSILDECKRKQCNVIDYWRNREKRD